MEDAESAAILEAVMARSLQDVQPADLAMDLDQALEWSKREFAEAELERQRRLLEEAAHRHGIIHLDDSDDDAPPQPRPYIGDPGQGSSRQVPPPPQDGQDDGSDGGNYTDFYRHFSM